MGKRRGGDRRERNVYVGEKGIKPLPEDVWKGSLRRLRSDAFELLKSILLRGDTRIRLPVLIYLIVSLTIIVKAIISCSAFAQHP
jgi:hypothetical protein